jgi:di/tricarboxylate transporter
MVEGEIPAGSMLAGRTLRDMDFRRRYHANVLAINRNGLLRRTRLQDFTLEIGDMLLLQADRSNLTAMQQQPDLILHETPMADLFRLHERLMCMHVPMDSALASKTIEEIGFGKVLDLTVVGIFRDDQVVLAPDSSEQVRAGDLLLVEGRRENLAMLHGLEHLEVEQRIIPDIAKLDTSEARLVEAILSPHTTLVGKTLRQLHFREKYGVNVLSIWREGEPHGNAEIADMPLRFGDALLLYGPWEKLRVLGTEPDFVLLNRDVQEAPRWEKAPQSILIMISILALVTLGWLPIEIAALSGATLMVVCGCLTVQEAYRQVEWRAVFLIAGMIPLATAMQNTGGAELLARLAIALVGHYGPLATLAGLYLVTATAAQIIPTPAVAMLMAPIALDTAVDLGLSIESLAMTVALASSASFMSPVAHPANTLVMGPGGYHFKDYLRVGLPLTLVVFLAAVLVIPIFWPIVP